MKERKEVKNGLVERSHNWMNNWGKEERERKTEKRFFYGAKRLWVDPTLLQQNVWSSEIKTFWRIYLSLGHSLLLPSLRSKKGKNTFFHLNWIQLKLIFYITSALLHFYLRLGWCFPRQVSALVVFCLLYPCTLPEMDIWALGEAQTGTAHSPISSHLSSQPVYHPITIPAQCYLT